MRSQKLLKYAGAARKKQRLEAARKGLSYGDPRRELLKKSLEAHRGGQEAGFSYAKAKKIEGLSPGRQVFRALFDLSPPGLLAALITGRKTSHSPEIQRQRAAENRISGLLAKGKAQEELSSLQGKGNYRQMDRFAASLTPKPRKTTQKAQTKGVNAAEAGFKRTGSEAAEAAMKMGKGSKAALLAAILAAGGTATVLGAKAYKRSRPTAKAPVKEKLMELLKSNKKKALVAGLAGGAAGGAGLADLASRGRGGE